MLGNAWDLSLRFTIEEHKRSFFGTHHQHWMGFRPADVAGEIFLGSQLDVLELALTHAPNGDDVCLRQDGKGIVILVPSQVVDLGSLV